MSQLDKIKEKIEEHKDFIESTKKSGLPEHRVQLRIAAAQGEIIRLERMLPLEHQNDHSRISGIVEESQA